MKGTLSLRSCGFIWASSNWRQIHGHCTTCFSIDRVGQVPVTTGSDGLSRARRSLKPYQLAAQLIIRLNTRLPS